MILLEIICASEMLFGCMDADKAVGPVSKDPEAELIDQAYDELMALNQAKALRKYSVYGGEAAALNMVSCGDPDKDGDSAYYNLKMLDTQLDLAPAMGKILKIIDVDNCADAKRFIEKKYEIIEGRPSTEMLMDGVAATADEALGKASIRAGVEENSRGKVFLEFPSGFVCTGSIIGPRAILTAAHCLIHDLISAKTGRRYVRVHAFPPDLPSPQKVEIADAPMSLIIHGPFAGEGDTQSDVALIIPDSPLPTQDYLKFYVGTMANGRRNRVYGAGNNAHAGTGYGVLRYGREYVDWYGEHHYYAEESGSMQTCPGDSGGPWVRDDGTLVFITGVHSGSDKASLKNCTASGGKIRAARMNTKIGWIGSQLQAYGAGTCTVSGDFAQCY